MSVRAFTAWQRFWHEPLRAERLAITRILLAFCLLTDQLVEYLPHLDVLYGPEGVAPAGTHDEWLLRQWRWTILLFNTDDMLVVGIWFGLWVAVTAAFLVGWHTRLMNVALWFLTMCFQNRNPALHNFGDDVVMAGLFLLMFAPSGRAFSLDRRRTREERREARGESSEARYERREKCAKAEARTKVLPAATVAHLSPLIPRPSPLAPQPSPLTLAPAWPVRLLQIQLCVIYLTTGLAKLLGKFDGTNLFEGTWWDGTSLHYVLNDVTLCRRPFAEAPVPFWLTAALTYVSVWWEVLFTPLVLFRRTRKWILWFGVFFHLGIFLTIEIGWFSFYTLALYGVWIPGEFWDRWRRIPPQNGISRE